MLQTVTAIIVARSGSTRVQRTLESLRAQTRRPDSVVVIEVGSDGAADSTIAAFEPTQHLATRERLSFPVAVAAAVRALDAPPDADQWLWLLAQDTAPEPRALEQLIAVGEVSPSVAVAGPKIVEWDDRTRLRGFGVSMTTAGSAVSLVDDELDQGQHDRISDVLGVHEPGMLVRHSVFDELGGLDAGLPVVDGGLDFCVRARLAGHRVVVAPGARVAIGGDGVVGPRLSQRTGAVRVGHRVRRAAQLHRRLAYAPAALLWLYWLSLVPFAIVRSVAFLIGKRPGAIGGELAAAFQTAFGGGHLGTARRKVRRAKRVGWAVIGPLRMPAREMRRRRMLAREAAIILAHGEKREIDFFGTGGGWVVLAMVAASVLLNVRLLGASVIGGGGLLPQADSVSQLWSGFGWGWRDVGLGFVGPSDPFQAVLAVLGSVTFWNPSFALVLVWLIAIPVAALGAWLLAAQLTRRPGARAVFAVVWAMGPPLLAALAAGRPAAVLAHVLLPWLVLAGVLARRSWAASGVTALLAAALVACSPSLIPALAIAWVVWTAVSGRAVFRALFVPLPAVALFLPLALTQLGNGHPERIFADPGLPVTSQAATSWQLLVGFPGGATSGWESFSGFLGWPAGLLPILLVIFFAPVALLALLALFVRPGVSAAGALLGAFLGLGTALVASHTALAVSGSHSVLLWSGSGLSLYWLGATVAALHGLTGLRRFSVGPAWLAGVGAIAAVVPLVLTGALGTSAVTASAAGRLPAYVTAEAGAQPRTATLIVTADNANTITAGVVHGSGDTLTAQSTVASTAPGGKASDARLDRLAVNLVSRSGYRASADLAHYGISFVFLETGPSAGVEEAAFTRRAAAALDGNALFTQVGATTSGTLWSTTKSVPAVLVPTNAGGWRQQAVVLMLIVVFGVFALLAIPIGRSQTGAPRRRMPAAAPAGGAALATGDDPGGESLDESAPSADDAPGLEPDGVTQIEPEPAFAGGGYEYEEEA
ncbi:glycosyltransferase family 2 protein [Gryllotalpicola reticulitermitis]|uniref:Glycosyltransferase family 2 protein n=1 Tax=Gryllotalpicola reticulitermitis TaxID=1184153 RepID=A0ABV8Q7X0_9MICO